MGTEHTPGPWTVNGLDIQGETENHIVVSNIADCIVNPADMQLIAAAPDLLEALINLNIFLVKHVPPEVIFKSPDAHVAALKAIAKAKGGAK